jgi:hypothetical protein
MPTTFLKQLMLAAAVSASLPLAACSIDVSDDDTRGRKDVDIRTPVGAMTVQTGVNADTGLAVYPGAAPLLDDREPESANVNIGTSLFGLRVAAAKFESVAPPETILDFYRNEMKAYGDVQECRGDIDFRGRGDSARTVCKERRRSRETQLAVGTKGRHRVVSVKPRGAGSEFAVVYIQTRGEG